MMSALLRSSTTFLKPKIKLIFIKKFHITKINIIIYRNKKRIRQNSKRFHTYMEIIL